MPQAYPPNGSITKLGPIQNGYGLSVSDTVFTIHEAITAIFSRLQPHKTWALIAKTLHLKEHAARHRAANHRDYTIEELQLLLQGENGAEILHLLMRGAEPAWWKALRTSLALSQARVAQAEWQQAVMALDNAPIDAPTRRKLKKVRHADRDFTATRAGQELAAGVLHQNLVRAVAGPVASPKERSNQSTGGR